jgi:hypothetical protein
MTADHAAAINRLHATACRVNEFSEAAQEVLCSLSQFTEEGRKEIMRCLAEILKQVLFYSMSSVSIL